MPSPFPGMDPFIEMFEWQDFHTTAITVMRELLTSALSGTYIVRVERRIYMEHLNGEDELRIADVAVVDKHTFDPPQAATATTQTAPTVECILPLPEEQRESYLLIKDMETRNVITVIELLSPTNKRRGSTGREEYLKKRETILESKSHLVELDLLRGGKRLPMRTRLPAGDYYAIVSRSGRRPRAEVCAWTLEQRLPQIAIPLKRDDPDVPLDLQKVLDIAYDRARYGDSMDYTAKLKPPFTEERQEWAAQLLQ